MKIFILILFLGSTLEILMLELPQYSSIEIRGTSYIYLNIENYEKEEICINVAGNGTQRSSNGETEYYLNIEFNYYFSNTNIFYKYATIFIKPPTSISSTGNYITNSYSIRFYGENKYLIMRIINNNSENTLYKITQIKPKTNYSIFIIYTVFSLVIILAIIFCVRDCIGTKKSNKQCMDVQSLAPLDNQELTDEHNSQI